MAAVAMGAGASLDVVRIDAAQQSAVVRTPDAALRTVRVGDTLPGSQLRVTHVYADRIEAAAPRSAERTWIALASESGHSAISTLSAVPPPQAAPLRINKTLAPGAAR